MNKILLLIICSFILSTGTAFAQSVANQGNIWYFNYNCGVDFNSGNPVSLNNSAMYTYEGCTSVSDSMGNLLFYSDGITVYNANHQVMQNGSNLNGGSSSSQACLAVRQPGSSKMWYLFTTAEAGGVSGAEYSTIDMTLQGGLGGVVTKNVPLVTPVEEKVTGCLQSNGMDYWILFHGIGNKKFYAFPLTSGGVGAMVTTTAGNISGNGVGCMKFSPDGSKLAIARYELYCVQVYDFDNATGVLTYKFTVPLGPGFLSYGIEWSRSSKRLFMGNVDTSPGLVYNVDMTLSDSTAIIASLAEVANGPSDIFGTLQMAPDGKIYLNRYNVFYLGVINKPDSLGAACNYVSNGFSTSPHNNYLGLPNYISSWFSVPDISSPVGFEADNNILCEKFCTSFADTSQNNPTSWQWSFPGGTPSSSTVQNPSNICYTVPGTYNVTLITTSASGNDTLTLPGFITVNPTPPSPTIVQTGYTLTSSPSIAYQWQFNTADIPGATNQSYDVMQTGFYTVVIGDSFGCKNSATVYVEITGVNEVGDANILISPNPSNGIITIDFSNVSGEQEISIDVVNTLGQIIYAADGMNSMQEQKIDLGEVPHGIYFIEVKSKTFSVKRKLLIIR